MSTHFKLNSEHTIEYFSTYATRMICIPRRILSLSVIGLFKESNEP